MAVDLIGSGWPFPVRARTFLGGEEKVRQSVGLILATAPGERLMRPDFGCGIHDLVFSSNTAAAHGMVAVKVREALTRWEPRIDVLDVRVDTPPGRPEYVEIRIDYRIRSSNAFHNLVYPFLIAEGVT